MIQKLKLNRKLFVTALVVVSVLIFISSSFVAEADDALDVAGAAAEAKKSGGAGTVATVAGTAVLMVVNVVLKALLSFVILLYEFAGKLVEFSIGASTDTLSDITHIAVGWAASRDLANIFFIFVLLVVAIATILRLENYGIKRLLPKLIIIAILINFSLLITQYVVMPSNWLSLHFVEQIKAESVSVQAALSNMLLAKTSLNVNTENTVQGYEAPHGDLFKVSDANTGSFFNNTMSYLVTGSTLNTEITRATVSLFSIVFFFIGAFVFSAIFIMVLIRTVVLMFLMVLSPLAFLFHILPATQGYARKWWQTLLSQSFFLPALLFLIYLTNILNTSVLQAQITRTSNVLVDYKLMFTFALMTVMLLASLSIARQMGAYGAGAAISWSKAAYMGAAGYAGVVLAARPAARAARAYTESKTGKRFAAESKIIGGAVFKGMQKASTMGGLPKTEKEELELLKKLPSEIRAQRFGNLSGGQKRAVLGGMNAGDLQELGLGMDKRKQAGEFTKEVRTLAPGREKELQKVLPGFAENYDRDLINKVNFAETPADHIVNNAKLREAVFKHSSPKQVQQILERSDKLSDAYREDMDKAWRDSGESVDKVVDTFNTERNTGMAQLFRSRQKLKDLLGLEEPLPPPSPLPPPQGPKDSYTKARSSGGNPPPPPPGGAAKEFTGP